MDFCISCVSKTVDIQKILSNEKRLPQANIFRDGGAKIYIGTERKRRRGEGEEKVDFCILCISKTVDVQKICK